MISTWQCPTGPAHLFKKMRVLNYQRHCRNGRRSTWQCLTGRHQKSTSRAAPELGTSYSKKCRAGATATIEWTSITIDGNVRSVQHHTLPSDGGYPKRGSICVCTLCAYSKLKAKRGYAHFIEGVLGYLGYVPYTTSAVRSTLARQWGRVQCRSTRLRLLWPPSLLRTSVCWLYLIDQVCSPRTIWLWLLWNAAVAGTEIGESRGDQFCPACPHYPITLCVERQYRQYR